MRSLRSLPPKGRNRLGAEPTPRRSAMRSRGAAWRGEGGTTTPSLVSRVTCQSRFPTADLGRLFKDSFGILGRKTPKTSKVWGFAYRKDVRSLCATQFLALLGCQFCKRSDPLRGWQVISAHVNKSFRGQKLVVGSTKRCRTREEFSSA